MTYQPAHGEPLVQRARLYTWLEAHPRVIDVVVIAVCVVPAIIALWYQEPGNAWFAQLCIAGTAVALWWRRAHPLAVLLVVAGLAAASPLYAHTLSVGVLETTFAAYTLATQTRLRTAVFGYLGSNLVVVGVSSLAALGGLRETPALGVVQPVVLVALAVGVAVRAVRARREALEELAVLREERAVAAERARITAEVHDVVAHSTTVMIALAGGARAGWEKHPERAREALEQLATVGAQALEDMQRTLRVLRDGGDVLGSAVGRSGLTLPDLDELIDVFRAAGLPVQCTYPEVTLGNPALRTTVYRIVQESLTNALRYAPRATLVEVEIEKLEHAVIVTVTDDGGPPEQRPEQAPGFGLRAMRERTAAFEGTLEAGPLQASARTPRGGWRTRATLALAGSAPRAALNGAR